MKVVYHTECTGPGSWQSALALITKHIDAEDGPNKIDVLLVVQGAAMKLSGTPVEN